ncbi:MAG: VOC family protein [Pseudomonadota bacterium]
MSDKPSIVPYISYTDGKAAIEFLTGVLGFTENFSQYGEDGALVHAELRYGNSVLLMGTADLPKGSPGLYLVIEDVDAQHARAVAGGATIVYPPEDTEWGTRRFRMKDPAGHEWTFGSYQPETEPPAWG